MAPFSNCSICQVRTRKVVRDRVIRKNIYLCQECCKWKTIEVQEEMGMTWQNVPNESLEVLFKNVQLNENDPGTKAEEAQELWNAASIFK